MEFDKKMTAEPPISEEQRRNKNLLVAIPLFGSIVFPGIIWLILRYASAGLHINYSVFNLHPWVFQVFKCGMMVEVAMIVFTLWLTLVNWRFLRRGCRLVGLIPALVLVLTVMGVIYLTLSNASFLQ